MKALIKLWCVLIFASPLCVADTELENTLFELAKERYSPQQENGSKTYYKRFLENEDELLGALVDHFKSKDDRFNFHLMLMAGDYFTYELLTSSERSILLDAIIYKIQTLDSDIAELPAWDVLRYNLQESELNKVSPLISMQGGGLKPKVINFIVQRKAVEMIDELEAALASEHKKEECEARNLEIKILEKAIESLNIQRNQME